MLHLVIDSNIYLSFFRYADDDLEELKKLVTLLKSKRLTLHVSEQVRNEYDRNRQTVIADTLKSARSAKLPKAFPQLLRNFDANDDLRKLTREFATLLDSLLAEAEAKARDHSLHADALIAELMGLATFGAISDDIVERAKRRFDLGNPPGKNRSYGDAVIWETTIDSVPAGADVHLVSDDVDYTTPLSPGELSDYLRSEWKSRRGSDAYLYSSLTAFFRLHYPDIKLSDDLERSLAIPGLLATRSFTATHEAIARLRSLSGFSESEVSLMVEAALANSQILWLLGDSDVYQFYRRVIAENPWVLDTVEGAELQGVLDEALESDSDLAGW